MKTITLTILSIFLLISCGESGDSKSNSVGETPEVKQAEPIKLEKKDPVAKTISIKEVSRIALVEAEQFITNAKQNGVDYSSVNETLEKAKKAFDNSEYKQAQVLAVKVRQQVEELMKVK